MKLYEDARFYTMEQEGEFTDNVLVENGVIKAVNVRSDDFPEAERISLAGNTVLPGLVDSHIHLLWYGQALERLNLSGTNSKQEALERIRMRLAPLSKTDWLFVEGYDENTWTDDPTLLSRQDLDTVSATNPILVRRIDYHSVSVNSALIRAAGITPEDSFSGGGEIVLDEKQEFTGILRDNATYLATDRFPEPHTTDLVRWLKLAVRDLWSKGITGAHSEDLHYFNGFNGTLAAFRETFSDDFPFRAQLLIHNAEFDAFESSHEQFMDGHPYVELDSMKIFYDGTVGSRTAYMTAGYADDPKQHGLKIQTDAEFEALVRRARRAELPVAIHILGDAAFRDVIRMLKKYPPRSGQHDRMIHTPWLTDELIEEAKGMPLLFDIQPQFLSSDLPWALDVLGENYPPRAFAWKTLLENGFDLAGGSDAPIEIPNPFYGIHAAVVRSANRDLNGKRYFEEEALTVYEAVQLYTTGSAKASYKRGSRGKIAPGFVADFTVVATNPFECSEGELREIQVVRTIVNDKTVFER
ncbi:amidohydrolase family protein [Listeria floridensis FSL S10-1187]|uniref:Amidohydrolase family protein n=1 Tax=Listeria floridensis FSL S10-1187 TaxID=1265817 RepID=A0ABN0RI71_9LIST|nr:amidohydrolase [Listeria floridensis]EUJ33683.1 amidohydrolase family protein [Listeria floridensis FSL S10-1187]